MSATIFDKLMEVVESDRRFHLGAYQFVFEGLEHTLRRLGKHRHVSGQELLAGMRELALQHFGLLAAVVFRQWGIDSTRDFGEIVFRLVGAGLMGKTETDSLADFEGAYDFDEAFTRGALSMPLFAGAGPEPLKE